MARFFSALLLKDHFCKKKLLSGQDKRISKAQIEGSKPGKRFIFTTICYIFTFYTGKYTKIQPKFNSSKFFRNTTSYYLPKTSQQLRHPNAQSVLSLMALLFFYVKKNLFLALKGIFIFQDTVTDSSMVKV